MDKSTPSPPRVRADTRLDRPSPDRAAGAATPAVPAPYAHLLRLQQSVGNAAVVGMLRRKTADFATTPAARLKSGWGFSKTPWDHLLIALKEYAAIPEGKLALRKTALDKFPALMTAWETHHQVGSKALNDDENAKVGALGKLRQLITKEYKELDQILVGPDPMAVNLQAHRFQGDAQLDQVLQGAATLVKGDTGSGVTRLQQALSDLGHLGQSKVNGTFDDDTDAAVKAFQQEKSLAASGTVDQATMEALESVMQGHGAEATLAKQPAVATKAAFGEYPHGAAPPELLSGTRDLSPGEEKAAKEVVKTSQSAGSGGALPSFVEDLPQGNYRVRLKTLIQKLVDWQFDCLAKGKKDRRKSSDLYNWAQIEAVAAESKKVTDAVFGKWGVGPPLKHGAGLHDAWDAKVLLLKDPTEADNAAKWRVDKLLAGDQAVANLDREHGAIQSRDPEKGIVEAVRDEVARDRRADLLEIHKAWPAFAGGGTVNLQRFKAPTSKGNRVEMWNTFHTVVHEYLHTLEHSRYRRYRESLGSQQAGDFTLREGVVEYFTFTVLKTVAYDEALRKVVEGEWHDDNVVEQIPEPHGYAERANAEKLAGTVGARNVMAAFFLGEVEKIGGTI